MSSLKIGPPLPWCRFLFFFFQHTDLLQLSVSDIKSLPSFKVISKPFLYLKREESPLTIQAYNLREYDSGKYLTLNTAGKRSRKEHRKKNGIYNKKKKKAPACIAALEFYGRIVQPTNGTNEWNGVSYRFSPPDLTFHLTVSVVRLDSKSTHVRTNDKVSSNRGIL